VSRSASGPINHARDLLVLLFNSSFIEDCGSADFTGLQLDNGSAWTNDEILPSVTSTFAAKQA